MIDGLGKTTQFTYDALSRLVGIAYPDGTSLSNVYDADGNRTSTTDHHGKTTFAWDALNRLVSVGRFDGKVTAYAYNGAGRRTTITYPDGHTAQYQYDGAYKLKSVSDWAGHTTSYSYDSAGNLLSTTLPNGVVSAGSYDKSDRVATVTNQAAGVTSSSFTYVLDALGNASQVASAAGGVSKYSYDALNRLTAWTAPSGQTTTYTYDAAGNRLSVAGSAGSTTYAYDDNDELLSAGTVTFTYDANGNRIARTAAGVTLTYAWDAAHRLGAITGSGLNIQYDYDGDSNRISQSANGANYTYVNDVSSVPIVLQESGPEGALDYLRGQSIIAGIGSTGTTYLTYDGAGNVINAFDVSGALQADYTYDPWGRLAGPLDPLGPKEKFKFAGQAFDSGDGLYYMRARYYDPSVGRFLSQDALGTSLTQAQDQNLYTYARNNPLRYVDPSGLAAEPTPQKDPTSADKCGVSVLGLFSVCGGGVITGVTGFTGAAALHDPGGAFTAGTGRGWFYDPGGAVTDGTFAQVGGFAGDSAIASEGLPDKARGVGLSAGAGVFLTNASNPSQLDGPFSTLILELGPVEIQFGQSGSTWIGSLTFGFGGGFGYSVLTTGTTVLTNNPVYPRQ